MDDCSSDLESLRGKIQGRYGEAIFTGDECGGSTWYEEEIACIARGTEEQRYLEAKFMRK